MGQVESPWWKWKDDPPGIAPEDRKRIFDRFYRARNGLDVKAEGTGLGLAIARSAVEANGGRLEYESAAAGGSRFRMTFLAGAPEIAPHGGSPPRLYWPP